MTRKKRIGLIITILVIVIAAPILWRATENSRDITQTRIEGNRLFISGTLNARTYDEIAVHLDNHPNLEIVELEQIDGSIDDEINLETSLLIHEAGLDTYVGPDANIQSGAVDLFCAGRKRIAHPDAQIGVHSWADNQGFSGDALAKDHPDHASYLAYFDKVGCTQAFYWFTLSAAPADDMHFMTRDELQTYGVVTRFTRF